MAPHPNPPQVKQLPSARKAAELIAKADALTVQIEEADLLRQAATRNYFTTVGLFLARYNIGDNVHTSATCGVQEATAVILKRDVVLKAMLHKEQFDRELARRGWRRGDDTWLAPPDDDALDPRFVVGIIAEHSDEDTRSKVRVRATETSLSSSLRRE